jgi:protoheme IX farnesyltransferase
MSGIFLLAGGGATLNNIQDRNYDKMFKRTQNRVLPQNKISIKKAYIQAIVLILPGLLSLWAASSSLAPMVLGIFSIILYNCIYTTLKPKTAIAIFPGVMCGMLPPFIGWIAAGGRPFDTQILTVMMAFGLWQVPHSWLVALKYHDDYDQAKIPGILNIFSVFVLKRVFFVWVVSFAFTLLLLVFLDPFVTDITCWAMALNAAVLVATSGKKVFSTKQTDYRGLFMNLNAALMAAMIIMAAERFAVFS